MSPENMTTRRAFLHRGLALVGATTTVPAFLERSALALAPEAGARTRSRPGMPDERVLVVVQLAGGNDGLNTVVPVRNDLYYKYRPTLGVARGEALKLTDEMSLHPSLTGLKALYDDTAAPTPERLQSLLRALEERQDSAACEKRRAEKSNGPCTATAHRRNP